MNLIAIYNVWGDSMELLRGSIKTIRSEVDFVLIVAQKESNAGEIDKAVYPFCNSLIDEGLADQVLTYEPVGAEMRRNETAKRQIGIEFAKTKGFSHFIHLDCDEYYFSHEFDGAKKYIEDNFITSSFVDLYTYYKEPTYRLANKEKYAVPFIHKVFPHTTCGLENRKNYPESVDPTRAISTMNSKKIEGISMHHFSYVRNDIDKKLRNSSAKRNINNNRVKQEYTNATEGSHLVALFNDKIIKVQNHFNIQI